MFIRAVVCGGRAICWARLLSDIFLGDVLLLSESACVSHRLSYGCGGVCVGVVVAVGYSG